MTAERTREGDEERTLRARDDVPISAVHLPVEGEQLSDLCLVVVHGFTGGWRQDRDRRVIDRLRLFASVVAIDMRGHGRSGGATTVGHEEIWDVEAAVAWARELGYTRVVTVGFSLGGAVVLREAALMADGPGRVDGVVSVSAPAFWYYKGTRIMRWAHYMVETRPGRLMMRLGGTRISGAGWPDPMPIPPAEAAGRLGDIPLLVVHGDVDHYFPEEHPRAIHAAAERSGVRTELWIEPGFGHAESAVSDEILDRIGRWVQASEVTSGPEDGECPARSSGSAQS